VLLVEQVALHSLSRYRSLIGATGGLSLVVSGAVLGSAVLHATWNALAKSAKDHLVGFVALNVGAGVTCLLVVPFVDVPAQRAWPYIAVSGAVHVAYQALLLQSYRHGDLSQVYPIARGTAPLLVALLAVPLADERLGGVQFGGVVLVAIGLVSLAHVRGWLASGRPPALAFAFATGLLITAYSLIDGLGVRRAESTLGYAAWLVLIESVSIPIYALVAQRARVARGWPTTWRLPALGGVLSIVAYGIVLWAQTRGALGAVTALRETGVIVAAVIGTIVFHERFGRRRLVAAVLVAGGVVLLNVG
jgi:drug/metabolite transporter (DMT)-like permease